MNPDGDYTEQSVSVYDSIVNESLISLAQLLGREDLLDYVRRNLRKLFCYIEPDGTVNTLNSRRQDYGVKAYPTGHYWSCLFLAHHDRDPDFAGMAELLLCRWKRHGNRAGLWAADGRPPIRPAAAGPVPPGNLPPVLPQLRAGSGPGRETPALTLLRDNPVFLKYQVGGPAGADALLRQLLRPGAVSGPGAAAGGVPGGLGGV